MRLFTTPGRYANVTATLALVVALSGSAYAGIAITGQQIKNGSITGADIKANSLNAQQELVRKSIAALDMQANSISGANIKQGSVTGADIKQGSVSGADIKANSIGPAQVSNLTPADFQHGAAGLAGPAGPTGPAGSALAYARINADGTLDPDASKNIAVVSSGGGIYCLADTAGTPHAVVGTIDVSGADSRKDALSLSAVPTALTACPAGTNIVVATASIQLTVNAPRPFYLAVIA